MERWCIKLVERYFVTCRNWKLGHSEVCCLLNVLGSDLRLKSSKEQHHVLTVNMQWFQTRRTINRSTFRTGC